MVIDVYSGFSKKPNSTKQPASPRASITCRLKEPCSVLNPIFLLTGYNLSDNYVKWGSRYYYINDIVIIGNELAEYHCSTDVLATYKTQIGSSSQYILRSSAASNGRIVDNYYPTLAKNTHEVKSITSPFVDDVSEGCYVIGIQGKGSGGNGGAVTYYKATATAMKALVNYLLSSPSSYQVTDISEELLECIFNPMQFIVSCMWYPFNVPTMNGDCTVGWWQADISGIDMVSTLEWGTNFSIPIPKHPKAATRGQYLNMPPFSRYKLQAAQWGIIPLDNFNLLDASNLEGDWKVDLITGSGQLHIKLRDKIAHEGIFTTQIGVPVQLGQNMFNQGALMSGINNTLSFGKSALTGQAGSMLTSGLGAMLDAASLSQAVPSTLGSNGTLSYSNIFAIMADFIDVADEDNAQMGRPLCEVRTISTIPGYILCEKADLDVAASPSEKDQIVSYMDGGFYYE